MPANPAPSPVTRAQLREQFIGDILSLAGDARRLWLPKSTDTTTSTGETRSGATITHSATLAGRLSALGLGYAVSFNGSSDYSSMPDAADLSFGNGATDQALSIVSLDNVTDTAGTREIAAKFDTGAGAREWIFRIDSSDKILALISDQSGPFNCSLTTTASATQGSWVLRAMTYSGVGGGSAGNGLAVYENAVSIAGTVSNNASYVAMEDQAGQVDIGASGNTPSGTFYQGSMAMLLICQKQLSVHELWAMKRLVNAYFQLSL